MQPLLCIDYMNENLGSAQVKGICEKLHQDCVKAISLRGCVLTDKDYKRVLKWIGGCHVIRHLGLNIGVVPDAFRVQVLAQALQKNTSLTGLFVHGNEIGDNGIKVLQPSLLSHPQLVSLDVGDCGLGDGGLEVICQLLVNKDHKPGLEELVLSYNPEITSKGWAKLAITIAAGCQLRVLYVDYNELEDSSASCLLVAIASARTMQTLDMECVGATDSTAQVLLHLVQSYSVSIQNINLDGNEISPATLEAIRMHLPGLQEDDQSNGIHSDEDHSLATSEPPLDQQSDFEDHLNSPIDHLPIVGETDSPAYTPDVDGERTDQLDTPDSVETAVKSQTIIVAEIETGEDAARKIDILNSQGKEDNTFEELEAQYLPANKAKNKSLSADPVIQKSTKSAKRVGNTGSLADRIKSKKNINTESQLTTAISIVEKDENDQVVAEPSKTDVKLPEAGSPFLKKRTVSLNMTSDSTEKVKTLAKVESVEEVEDIEGMDEAAINTAHDNLTVPDTPSKMSLCTGPGVSSTSSIFEENQMLRLSPSSSFNRQRRFSHNIEIKQDDKQKLQAKHRGSEGNIIPGLTKRRGSGPSNARLTVHGVGTISDTDDVHADNTRRRLSCGSTLGDVDIVH